MDKTTARRRLQIPPESCLQWHLLKRAVHLRCNPFPRSCSLTHEDRQGKRREALLIPWYQPTCFPSSRVTCAISSLTFVTDRRASSSSSQKATGPDGVLMGGFLIDGFHTSGSWIDAEEKVRLHKSNGTHRAGYYVHYLNKYQLP